MKKIPMPIRVGVALLLAAIAAALVIVAGSANTAPEQVPVSFQLLANDGSVYANGWHVDGAIVLEDPDDKLDVVALACCESSCTPEEASHTVGLSSHSSHGATSSDPGDTATPAPTGVPTETVEVTPEPTRERCDRGVGNGAEGCDPGNSGGQPGNAGENDG